MVRPPRRLPDSTASRQPPPNGDILLPEVLRALRPLVRALLAAGVDYTRLTAALKPVFVEQARRQLAESGRKETDSALSLLSGVHRKDIRNWRETGLAGCATGELSVSNRVFARWMQDPDYQDRRRRPRALPRLGPAPSFESLARSVTLDLRPFNVLAELVRLGLARIEPHEDGDVVVPNRDGFVPPPGSRELLELFGGNLSDHAATAVANLLGDSPRLEQSVYAEGISAASARQLHELARKLWAQARREMIGEAQRLYDADRGHPEAAHRVRFGMYFWDEAGSHADGVDIDEDDSDGTL